MEDTNFSSGQSVNFQCGFPQEEKTRETLISDHNWGLSLGSIYDANFKGRGLTKSFTGLIDLNKDTVELGKMLSLEMSGLIPIEGEQEEGSISRGGIAGEEKYPEVVPWMVALAEKNPAVHRPAKGCKFPKRLRMDTSRNRDSLMGEASREINFSSGTIDGHTEVLLHRSLEKTKETQLANQVQRKCFDLNLTLSLSGINDDNCKEKPLAQSSSVSCLIDLTKDSDELSNKSSLARSCSIPTKGKRDKRMAIKPRHFKIEARNSLEKQRSRAYNIGKEKVSLPIARLTPSSIAPWAVSYVENNPALNRALFRIKEAAEEVWTAKDHVGPDAPQPAKMSIIPDIADQKGAQRKATFDGKQNNFIKPSPKIYRERVAFVMALCQAIGRKVMEKPEMTTMGRNRLNESNREVVLHRFMKGPGPCPH